MNINLLGVNGNYRMNHQQSGVESLLEQKKFVNRQIDMFIKSGNAINDIGLYSPFKMRKSNYISDTLLLHINNNMSGVIKTGDVYEYDGNYFTADQIPKIDVSSLSEVKACNNTIDFGKRNYFKYVSSDGREHALFTTDKSVKTLFSEYIRGAENDTAAQDYAEFWRYMMSRDPVYYSLDWSQDEVRKFMSDAGIKTGFFTVKMGEREATQYYSASETAGVIHSKERYDSKYEDITSVGYQLMKYEPGSVFKLNGREYILSENHTLDIPYGEDLWCLEYPSNYRFGKKVK